MAVRAGHRNSRVGVIRRATRAFTFPTITPKDGGWIA